MENLNAEQIKSDLVICVLGDCQACHYNKFIAGCRDELCGDALALINSQEQRIKELAEENERLRADTIEEYRQKVNTKMGKHTHLLGKEYVQRILREVKKEMVGDNDV